MRQKLKELCEFAIQKTIEQGHKSMSTVSLGCQYNGPNGDHCVIGWMLTKQTKINPSHYEGCTVAFNKDLLEAVKSAAGLMFPLMDDEIYFLVRLQRIHDNHAPEFWKDRFAEIMANPQC